MPTKLSACIVFSSYGFKHEDILLFIPLCTARQILPLSQKLKAKGKEGSMEKNEMHKPIEELNVLDDFLFREIVMDKEHGEEFIHYFLKTVLECEISISEVKAQMVYTTGDPNLRAIRMDVVTQGTILPKERNPVTGEKKETFVDVEMQKQEKDAKKWKKENLRNRSRLYQGLLDVGLLKPGQSFGEIPNVLIIICMPFDLFKYDRMIYTFQHYCEEVPGLALEDGAKRIFLNTKGKIGGRKELQEMLQYIENSIEENVVNSELKTVHNLVTAVRQNKEVRVKYMLSIEHEQEIREEGREEGKKEGIEEGRKEGLEAFILDNLEENISRERILEKLQRRFELSEEKAKAYLEKYSDKAAL